jgi:hypothetical protein
VSSAERADELELAPLANLRGSAESTDAQALVGHLADRYPRKPGNSEKPYARLKTKAGHENAIGALLGELLAAYGEDRSRPAATWVPLGKMRIRRESPAFGSHAYRTEIVCYAGKTGSARPRLRRRE